MKRYSPSLFDKLLDGRLDDPGASLTYSAEQIKSAVARDMESLLNARRVRHDGLDALPSARASVLSFGLVDISSMSLASDKDRASICESIAQAIRYHDSRLRDVRVELRVAGELKNVPGFVIHANLKFEPLEEPVSFDAVLEATSRSYHVSLSNGRSASLGVA